jgi:Holliday junction DNA helicase RuvB
MKDKPSHDINDASPQVVEQYIGQTQVVNRLRIMLDAAFNDGNRLPHLLFAGPGGLGKTELAHVLMKEMANSEIHETLGQNLATAKDLNAFLLTPQDREVALIDEIHECGNFVGLYRAMENGEIFLNGEGNKKFRSLKIANFTLIGCTTDPHCLPKPLLDRFEVLQFDFYSDAEMELLLKQRARQYPWQFDEGVISSIAQLSRYTPRIGIALLRSVIQTARAENSPQISMDHFKTTIQLEGLDNLGLRSEERKYLKILAEQSEKENRPIRLGVLSSILGLNPKTVSQTIEDYLLRMGLISRTDGGRRLTEKGWEHVDKTLFDNKRKTNE